ncbi:MAG: FkbM family methyltransferase [Anaerolineae bacterium]
MSHPSFLADWTAELVRDFYQVQENNRDGMRFPVKGATLTRLRNRVREGIFSLAARQKLIYADAGQWPRMTERLTFILERAEAFQEFYATLADDPSRAIMVKVLAFQGLGSRRVKLPTNNPRYWQSVALVKGRLCAQEKSIQIPSLDGWLNRYDLSAAGFPIRLNAHPLNILATFLLEQYGYNKEGAQVQVAPGDVVIDAGACWGDTTLYFAARAGETGVVHAFEFFFGNLMILEENLTLNPELKSRIRVIPRAVWSVSESELSFVENGPGSTLDPNTPNASSGATRARTLSLDDFVEQKKLERVDFVKMDIEGAELDALKGSAQTIRRFKPKLAIAVYHKPDDLIVIPRYIQSLGVDYRYYLDHFSIHAEETVLFARPV